MYLFKLQSFILSSFDFINARYRTGSLKILIYKQFHICISDIISRPYVERNGHLAVQNFPGPTGILLNSGHNHERQSKLVVNISTTAM